MAPLKKDADGELDYTPEPIGEAYTLLEIFVGTLIGGPLAGCHMMSENYRAFRRLELVNRTRQAGTVVMVLIFGGWAFGMALPKLLGVIGYTVILTFLAKKLQGESIRLHLLRRKGGHPFSDVIKVGFYSLALSLGFLILVEGTLGLFAPPEVRQLTPTPVPWPMPTRPPTLTPMP